MHQAALFALGFLAFLGLGGASNRGSSGYVVVGAAYQRFLVEGVQALRAEDELPHSIMVVVEEMGP
jgi:hypothetical protein